MFDAILEGGVIVPDQEMVVLGPLSQVKFIKQQREAMDDIFDLIGSEVKGKHIRARCIQAVETVTALHEQGVNSAVHQVATTKVVRNGGKQGAKKSTKKT